MRCLNCHQDQIAVGTQVCPQCGVSLTTLMRDVLAPGTQLQGGGYRIDYALGQGGLGITYRGMDLNSQRPVAIKEFYPKDYVQRDPSSGNVIVTGSSSQAFQNWLQRFERDGGILARLTHPGVVKVFSLFKERNTLYWVMELLEGWTLKEELNAQPGKRLAEPRVVEVMTALVSALDMVHQAGGYHLDLKPDNVLLTQDRRIVLIDFGSAHTPEYAAPELLSGEQADATSDVFALGMMLHELLTGTRPPSVLNRLSQDIWEPPNLNEPWRGMITQALRLQRTHRPPQVRQWWQTYAAASNQPVQAAPMGAVATIPLPAPGPSTPRSTRPWLVPVLAGCGGLLFLAFVGIVGGVVIANQAAMRAKEAKTHLESGKANLTSGNYQGALDKLNQAIRLSPESADAFFRRGLAKINLGNREGAVEDYNQAIRLDPKLVDAYVARGNARYQLGEKEAALKDYNRAMQIDPTFAPAYFFRGETRSFAQDYQGALDDYDLAISHSPNYAEAYVRRGDTKFSLKNYAGAIADYSQAIRIIPNYAAAYYGRGYTRYVLGSKESAVLDLSLAIRISPEYADAYASRAVIFTDLGERQAAIKDFQTAQVLYQKFGMQDQVEWTRKRLLELQ